MKPWLCAAGTQLRDQIDTWYADRRTTADGWLGDARHSTRKSDHNPDADGCVRPLMWILAWIHPKGSRYIWLTRSEYVARPINAYLT